jgi:hypothetical protein
LSERHPRDIPLSIARALRPAQVPELALGTDEEDPTRKTYITSEHMVILAAGLSSYVERLEKGLTDLWRARNPDKPIGDRPDWSSLRVYRAFHRDLLETMASYEGFSLRIAARADSVTHIEGSDMPSGVPQEARRETTYLGRERGRPRAR